MSEVKSTAEACYDARMALIKERDELARQVSELQLSQKNIINALGIKGEGAHSKLVIEYVSGLVAEIVALKKFIVDECVIPHEFYGDNKDAADFMPATPNTDAAIAEIGAKAVEAEFSRTPDAEIKWDGTNLTVQNVRDGFSFGVTPVFVAANLRAGRDG